MIIMSAKTYISFSILGILAFITTVHKKLHIERTGKRVNVLEWVIMIIIKGVKTATTFYCSLKCTWWSHSFPRKNNFSKWYVLFEPDTREENCTCCIKYAPLISISVSTETLLHTPPPPPTPGAILLLKYCIMQHYHFYYLSSSRYVALKAKSNKTVSAVAVAVLNAYNNIAVHNFVAICFLRFK